MSRTKMILIAGFIVFILIAIFYYYIAIKWGQGMAEVAKEYIRIKEDLSDTIPSRLDTLYEEVKSNLDTLIQ